MEHYMHHIVTHSCRNPFPITLFAKLRKSPLVHTMVPQVAVIVDQFFQLLVRYLYIKKGSISITRGVGNGINAATGMKMCFRYLFPILGVRTSTNDHLLVISIVFVAVIIVVLVGVIVVVVAAAVLIIVADAVVPDHYYRHWGW